MYHISLFGIVTMNLPLYNEYILIKYFFLNPGQEFKKKLVPIVNGCTANLKPYSSITRQAIIAPCRHRKTLVFGRVRNSLRKFSLFAVGSDSDTHGFPTPV
jgi:hypothetical protein